jgi:AcrR family transcriptional regulator
MSREERRSMIVAAALPLVSEYGAAVTTSRIAQAAGIGEATVFRVFTDKNEILAACVAEAVQVDRVVTELRSIPRDEPLRERMIRAAAALRAHSERVGAVVGTLHASGHLRRERGGPKGRPNRAEAIRAVRDAITDVLTPAQSALRLPPDQLAAVFVRMFFLERRLPGAEGDTEPSPTDLADLFLHGALGRP